MINVESSSHSRSSPRKKVGNEIAFGMQRPPLGAPDSETMAAPLSTGPHGLPSAVAEGPEDASLFI